MLNIVYRISCKGAGLHAKCKKWGLGGDGKVDVLRFLELIIISHFCRHEVKNDIPIQKLFQVVAWGSINVKADNNHMLACIITKNTEQQACILFLFLFTGLLTDIRTV